MNLNYKGAEMIGEVREKLVNSTFGFFVSDESKKEFSLFLKRILISREKETCELVLKKKDSLTVEVVMTGIAEDEEKCLVTAIITNDIKTLERELISKEQRLQMAITSTGIGTYSFDFVLGTAEYSKEFLDIYDLQPNNTVELDSDLVPIAIYPEDKKYFLVSMNRANDPFGSGVLDFEFRIKTTKGNLKWLRSTGLTVFGLKDSKMTPLYANGIIREITYNKATEEALKKSEAEFRSLFENSIMGISQASPEGKLLRINKAYAEMYGYPDPETMLNEVANNSIQLYSDPENRKKVIDILDKEGVMNPAEFELNRRNGEKFWALVGAKQVRDDSGNLIYLQAEHIDITRRKKDEEEFKAIKSKLELAMNAAEMAWWEMDIATGNVIFERSKAEMLGYLPEKFHHYKDFMALVHPDDYDAVMNAMLKHLNGEADRYETEYRILNSSGNYKWFYDVGSIVRKGPGGEPLKIIGMVIDFSVRKNTELLLSKKMEELEKFNNLMIDREIKMIELKKEVNDLLRQIGNENKYRIVK